MLLSSLKQVATFTLTVELAAETGPSPGYIRPRLFMAGSDGWANAPQSSLWKMILAIQCLQCGNVSQ
jgi:hypothetical protein